MSCWWLLKEPSPFVSVLGSLAVSCHTYSCLCLASAHGNLVTVTRDVTAHIFSLHMHAHTHTCMHTHTHTHTPHSGLSHVGGTHLGTSWCLWEPVSSVWKLPMLFWTLEIKGRSLGKDRLCQFCFAVFGLEENSRDFR